MVSILNRTAQVGPDGDWIVRNVPSNIGAVRARVTCVQNGRTRVGMSDLLEIPIGNATLGGISLTLEDVEPVPLSLALSAPETTFPEAGGTVQLTATATFDDLSTRDVTAPARGTRYVSSNRAVASVDANGLVTMHSSGNVILSATNEGTLALLRITIASILDSDGDGMPDDYELANGLAPFDPSDARSDYDWDNLFALDEYRLGTDPNNYDTDNDEISDGLEVQTGTDPLDPASFDLSQTLTSIFATPNPVSMILETLLGSSTQQLRVRGRLVDEWNIDITSRAKGTTYGSTNPTVAAVNSFDGRIEAVGNGSTTITIANNGHETTVPVNVTSFAPGIVSTTIITGLPQAIAVNGNFVYVMSTAGKLSVVDVTNRASPLVVGTITVAMTPARIAFGNNRLYVAHLDGVAVFNVSIPTAPTLLRNSIISGGVRDVVMLNPTTAILATNTGILFQNSGGTTLGSVSIPDTRAVGYGDGGLIAAVNASGLLHVVDVRNGIASANVRSTLSIGTNVGVSVWGEFAYFKQNTSLGIADIGHPTPKIVSSNPFPGFVNRIFIREGFAFVGMGIGQGYAIADVGDASAVSVRRQFSISSLSNAGIAADQRHVYALLSSGTSNSTLSIAQYFATTDNEFQVPVPRIASPADGSTFTEGAMVPINIEAFDNGMVDSVSLFVNGWLYTSTKARDQIVRYRVPPNVTDLAMIARATDFANMSNTSPTVTYHVVRDTTPPSVQITSPTAGAIVGGRNLTVTANATDDSAVVRVEFFVNGASIGVDTTAPYAATTFIPATGVSSITLTATATDSFGLSATSNPVTLPVQPDQPPTVRILSPLNGAGLYAGADVTVALDVADDDGIRHVFIYADDDFLTSIHQPPYTVAITLPAGVTSFRLIARATDTKDQESEDSVQMELMPTSALSALPLPAWAWDVVTRGDVAYVAGGTAGLHVIDIANLDAPSLITTLSLAGEVFGVVVPGRYAYVAGGAGGLHVIDLANPTAPVLVGSIPLPHPRAVTVDGDRLAVATDAGVSLFDLRRPAAPQPRGEIATPAEARHALFVGDTLFLVHQNPWWGQPCSRCDTLVAVDVSDLSHPLVIDTLALSSYGMAVNSNVIVMGSVMLIPTDDYIISVDISDPSALREIARYDEVNFEHSPWRTFAKDGGLLFAATDEMQSGQIGVQIIDPANPAVPRFIGQIDFSPFATSFSRYYVNAIAPSPELVHVVFNDAQTRTDKFSIGRYRTITDTAGAAPSVSIAAPLAGAVFAEQQGVSIDVAASDDIAVDSVTILVDGVPVTTLKHAPFTTLHVPSGTGSHTVTAIATDFGGNNATAASVTFHVVADTTAPTVAITAPRRGGTVASMTMTLRAAASDDTAVASVSYRVNGVDVGTPTLPPYEVAYTAPAGMTSLTITATATDAAGNTAEADPIAVSIALPQVVGSLSLPGTANRVAVNGSHAYVASNLGLQIVDVSQPAAPSLIRTVAVGPSSDVRLFGNHAYVATNSNVAVVDITSPASAATFATVPVSSHSLDLIGTRALIAGGNTLYQYELANPQSPQAISQRNTGTPQTSVHASGEYALTTSNSNFSKGQLNGFDLDLLPNFVVWYNDMNGATAVGNNFNDLHADGRSVVIATSTGLTSGRFGTRFVAPLRLNDPFGFRAIARQGEWLVGIHGTNTSGVLDPNAVLFDFGNGIHLVPHATIFSGITGGTPTAVDLTPTHVFITSQHSGTSRLTIAKVHDFSDGFGVAPAVTVSADGPASRDRLLRIKAAASDDVGVASVTFTVNGVDVFTDTTAPYDMTYVVPSAATSPLVIGARATDFGGNVTPAANVTLPVQ
ncbi:MAG: Ig-like domain-containing protein [Acidobacteriota bacterium]|nr:Ig-like domain-containing protein [Acidobacteriota bacterium]